MRPRPRRGPAARVGQPLAWRLPFVRHWSLLRQLAGVDPAGRGAAVLSPRTTRLLPRTATADRVVPSVCPHCGVGCGLQVHVAGGRVVNVEGDPASPLSRGRLCPTGAAVARRLADPGRWTGAMHRPAGDARWRPVELHRALDLAAERIVATRRRTWQWEDAAGRRVRRAAGLAWLAGDGVDLEACYLADKLATALGVAPPAGPPGPLAVLADATGRAGSTASLPDLAAADCIVLVGVDPARSHPVAMRWVAEARSAGATVVHVHPGDTATGALADLHVPVRPGTASALLRGAVAAVLAHDRWRRPAVAAYTDAAALVGTEDTLLGAPGDAVPAPPAPGAGCDESLRDDRTVLQRVRAAVAGDTPAAVAAVCGVEEPLVERFWRTVADHSTDERTTAVVTAAGPAGPSDAADVTRAAATLQLLLGNVGRPGGGVLVLHGDAGAPAPFRARRDGAAGDAPAQVGDTPAQVGGRHGPARPAVPADLLPGRPGWPGPSGTDARAVSLRKAWWGAAATAANAFGDDWVPRPVDDGPARAAAAGGGWVVLGDGVGSSSGTDPASWVRQARALSWIVVHGSAPPAWVEAVGGPGGPEVIFVPAAHPVEHRGTLVSSDRLLQRHQAAADPPGAARSALWVTYRLGQRVRRLLEGSADAADEPVLALTWDYAVADEPSAGAVLAEANGWDATGRLLAGPGELRADGATACGLSAVCGVLADGRDRAAHRPRPDAQGRNGRGWGWAWPGDRRVLGNRASADPDGRPWSERARLVRWDGEQACWVGDDEPDIDPTLAPTHRPPPGVPGARAGTDAFPDRPDGRGRLAVPPGPAAVPP